VAGAVIICRTSKSAARLSSQFRDGKVSKTYLAVVQGRPPKSFDRLDHHLIRIGRFSKVADSPMPSSQQARLSYRLLDRSGETSLLEVNLETGRRHQIRSQLSSVGLPIVGDRHYGSDQSLGHGRIALLAYRLEFLHPTLKTPIHIECPLPFGWPWPFRTSDEAPLWTIEEYEQAGLVLPVLPIEDRSPIR
jgi:23S rRNA pseudouridine1911/1915/1917 synthase